MAHHFRTSPNQTKIYGIWHLTRIVLWGGKQKYNFLNFWNSRVAQLTGKVEFWIKAEVSFNAMMQSKDLQLDMFAYQKNCPASFGERKGEKRYKVSLDIQNRTVN